MSSVRKNEIMKAHLATEKSVSGVLSIRRLVRRTLLKRFDNCTIRIDMDPDQFLADVYQLDYKLAELDETVSEK